MAVQPTMGPIAANTPAASAAVHGSSSAGATSFLGRLQSLLTTRPSSLPQPQSAQPTASPVTQSKTSQKGAGSTPSSTDANEQAPAAPEDQNSETAVATAAMQPQAVELLSSAGAGQNGLLPTDATMETKEPVTGSRTPQRQGASQLAGHKSDAEQKQTGASVCVLSTPIQSGADALPASAKEPDPPIDRRSAETSGDQQEPVQGRARSNEVPSSPASNPADASGEMFASAETKPGQPDMLVPADPAPPISASKATEPTLTSSMSIVTSSMSIVMSQPTAAPAAAAQTASAQVQTGTGTASSPAAQITPAMVSLATTSSGTQRLTVQLDPEELGRVEIRIEQPKDGPAHVTVTVDRPETLDLLLRDQPQLQHALNQAGVPTEGRTVTFHVTGTDPASWTNQHAPTDTSGGSMQANAGGSHREQRSARPSKAADNGQLEPIPSVTSFPVSQVRLGLDITA